MAVRRDIPRTDAARGFHAVRNWCKWGKAMAEMTREDVRYFVALAEAIRARLG